MKWIALLFLLFILAFLSHSIPLHTIHIINHSHWDVGWLKTPELYYNTEVKFILSGVVQNLSQNKNRKFVLGSEIYYIEKWWNDATVDDSLKQTFKQLIQEYRIELVGGGFTMPDEAVTSYYSLVQTMTRGHAFLVQTFGEKYIPKISWRIDPFGTSSVMTEVYLQSGKNYSITMRNPFDIQDVWRQDQKLEYFWQLSNHSQVFTTILDYQYCIWNIINQWLDPTTIYNVQSRAQDLIQEAEKRYLGFSSGHVLLPYGCDFSFQDTSLRFLVMEPIIEYILKSKQYQIQQSTLSDYFIAVQQQQIIQQTTHPIHQFEGNLLPFGENSQTWWSGYYSSYPVLKKQVTNAEYALKVSNLLFAQSLPFALKGIVFSEYQNWYFHFGIQQLDLQRQIVSAMTHHDAVTGTSKRSVNQEYSTKMEQSMTSATIVMAKALEWIINGTESKSVSEAVQWIPISEDQNAIVLDTLQRNQYIPIIVYNPLSQSVTQSVTLSIVKSTQYEFLCITDASTKEPIALQFVIQSLDSIATTTTDLIVTQPLTIPALGMITLHLQWYTSSISCVNRKHVTSQYEQIPSNVTQIVLQNEFSSAIFCANGKLCNFMNSTIQQDVMQFTSVHDQPNNNNAGAYVFLPEKEIPQSVTMQVQQQYVLQGPFVTQLYQVFSNQVKQIIRLPFVKYDASLIVETIVGPLLMNTEIVTRWCNPNIKNEKRIVNFMNGYTMWEMEYLNERRIAGNMYPLTFMAMIQDDWLQMTSMVQRAHAVSSSVEGCMDILLHRRCSTDDGKGLSEALDDSTIAKDVMKFVFSKRENQPSFVSQAHAFQTPLLVMKHVNALPKTVQFPVKTSQLLKKDLPSDMQVFSMDVQQNSLLLRMIRQNISTVNSKTSIKLDEYLNYMDKSTTFTETNLIGLSKSKTSLDSSTVIVMDQSFDTITLVSQNYLFLANRIPNGVLYPLEQVLLDLWNQFPMHQLITLGIGVLACSALFALGLLFLVNVRFFFCTQCCGCIVKQKKQTSEFI